MEELRDFLEDNWKTILIFTLIAIVVGFIVWAIIEGVKLDNKIEEQPIQDVIGIVQDKLYVPESERIVTSYNSNTKANDIYTVYDDEEFETYILLTDTDEIKTKYDKDTYIRYNKGDSLWVSVKRYNGHTKIKQMRKYSKQTIDEF